MGTIIWQKAATMNTTGGASVMGSYPYPRNGIIKIDYEWILLFKKLGTAPPVERERKERSRLTKEEWNQYFRGHWNFPGERQDKHLAMFPAELPKRLIKEWIPNSAPNRFQLNFKKEYFSIYEPQGNACSGVV